MVYFLEYLNKHINLTPEEELIISSKFRTRTYLKGQYITQSGDVNKLTSFIEAGMVRTFFLDDHGVEHNIAFGIENWWVADLGSFISQSPADFNVQCMDQTNVVQITYMELQELYREVPKMERLFRIITENAYVSSQRRIVRNFSLSATERYLLFLDEYPTFAQRVPQYMIASYLGITKEFLSNIRSQISKSSKS